MKLHLKITNKNTNNTQIDSLFLYYRVWTALFLHHCPLSFILQTLSPSTLLRIRKLTFKWLHLLKEISTAAEQITKPCHHIWMKRRCWWCSLLVSTLLSVFTSLGKVESVTGSIDLKQKLTLNVCSVNIYTANSVTVSELIRYQCVHTAATSRFHIKTLI